MTQGNGDRLDNLIQVLVESNARAEERFRQHEERMRLGEERLTRSEERLARGEERLFRLEDNLSRIEKSLEILTSQVSENRADIAELNRKFDSLIEVIAESTIRTEQRINLMEQRIKGENE